MLIACSAELQRCIPGGRVREGKVFSWYPWRGVLIGRMGRLRFLVECRLDWYPLSWDAHVSCLILEGNPCLFLPSWFGLIYYYYHSCIVQRGICYPCWMWLGIFQLDPLWFTFLGPGSWWRLSWWGWVATWLAPRGALGIVSWWTWYFYVSSACVPWKWPERGADVFGWFHLSSWATWWGSLSLLLQLKFASPGWKVWRGNTGRALVLFFSPWCCWLIGECVAGEVVSCWWG